MQKKLRDLIGQLGIDTRLIGMVGAIVVLWIAFDLVTEGRYLTPRNLFNLSVQTASVAVMATGMVFIIVMRHIDLSVGSLLGFVSMLMGALQLHFLPDLLGHGHWSIWIITIVFGVICGIGVGALQGWLVGYVGVPAFIVTLGGLLIWRGAAWWTTQGQTVAPLDKTFRLLGGGAEGTLGFTMSWVLGLVGIAVLLLGLFVSRQRKVRHGFAVRPVWAELTVAGIGVFLIAGFVHLMNSYPIPARAAKRMYEAKGLEVPEGGLNLAHGIAIPVVIVLIVGVVMTIVATRTRFGRYVFATGGNPDAAALSGINTKAMTVKIFALMGGLAALAGVIASARLGAVGNDLGTLDELRVIAAAVIGGTALSGGIGTIYGAILGAIVMQSLQSGMAMVGVDAPLQSIVVGVVLVLAVIVDGIYRKRTGGK